MRDHVGGEPEPWPWAAAERHCPELAGMVVDPSPRLAGPPCDLARIEERRRRLDGAQTGCEAIGEGVEQPIVIDELGGEHGPLALLASAALILDGAVWTPAVRS